VTVLFLVKSGLSGSAGFTNSGESALAAAFEIAVLVFREGLECVLVLAAVTASMKGGEQKYRRPVCAGVGMGVLATLLTWFLMARILDDLGGRWSALALQAATGLLAIIVLLVVMNWFFHRIYWTGWISLHNKRKRALLGGSTEGKALKVFSGMAMLGFTSLYREGFEIVLFLQGYRLRLGGSVVLLGVVLGVIGAVLVAALTFAAQRHLPFRKMLVSTGLLLGVVLLVMVGEEAQEMQLAGWLPITYIPFLRNLIPSWMGLWLSIFPSLETLSAQGLAGVLVVGSYITARKLQTVTQA
jgi:high-affinity iron transporter